MSIILGHALETLTRKIDYASVVQTLACGPHTAHRQFLYGPRTLSVCRTLHKVINTLY